MKTRSAAKALFTLGMLASAGRAHADGLIVEDPGTQPALCPLEALAVDAALDDQTAQLTETRRYRLPPAAAGTATRKLRFLRSLPDSYGSRVIELRAAGAVERGQQHAPAAADDLREQLAVALHDPAPLRELGSALYVAELSVPAETTQLEIVVTGMQPLRAFGSLHGVALPLDWHKQAITDMRVDVSAAAEAPLRVLFSPYHALTLDRPDAHRAKGHYQGYNVCTELDLVMLASSGDEPIRLDVVPFRRSPAEDGQFLALLSPPLEVDDATSAPRDIAIALDVSGSMQGEKIASAKEALRAVLAGLRPDDAIALVSFNGEVAQLAPSVQAATTKTLDAARSYVDGLVADGGTNIHDALVAALAALPAGRGRPRYGVLITDGVPTAGITDVNEIVSSVDARNEIGARIFSFGVGDDVNTVLLDRLAADSGGSASYIRPGDSIAAAVASFFQQIRDPVLTDPVLDFGELAPRDLHPDVLPDLFAGQQVAVLGRFDFAGETTVTLRGRHAGEPVEQRFALTVPEQDLDNAYAARIWALRHVGSLLEAIKQGASDPALDAEVAEVARRFGVVTEFTRLITDSGGNSELSYSGVPTEAVGAQAVTTSTTLSGYASGGAVSAAAVNELRYSADRTLIWRDGFYTDTSLAAEPDYVDLTFGSTRYFELARSEAAYGAAGLLSVHPNVRFELLGRAFRVTADDGEGAPPEREIPLPDLAPVTGATAVAWLGDDNGPTGATAEPPRSALGPSSGAAASDERADEQPRSASYGCSLSAPPSPSRTGRYDGLTLTLLAILAVRRPRRRPSPSRSPISGS